jgi:polar amino acid transport system substrate-binding protein
MLLWQASRRRVGGIITGLLAAALLAIWLPISRAKAQTCGSDYILKEGDTLARIAAQVYGDPGQWTIILYANQDRLGSTESLLVPGAPLKLPCISGLQPQRSLPPIATTPAAAVPEAAYVSSVVRRIEFLTADGYNPYTGRTLEGGGMLTEVVGAAMALIKQETKGRFDHSVSWVNDWSAHLNPLLVSGAFDAGFPWARPDCDGGPLDASSQLRCLKFLYSDALTEVATYLFVRKNSRVRTLSDEDIAGTTLCRASVRPTQELDQGGRNWLRDGKITVVRQPTSEECFRLLDGGSVDGVVEADLVGRASANALGIAEKVQAIEQPLALTTLHVAVAKSHPQARAILYYINTSLAKLRDSGEYERIVGRHLAHFWQAQTEVAKAVAAGKSDPTGVGPTAAQELAPLSADAAAKTAP